MSEPLEVVGIVSESSAEERWEDEVPVSRLFVLGGAEEVEAAEGAGENGTLEETEEYVVEDEWEGVSTCSDCLVAAEEPVSHLATKRVYALSRRHLCTRRVSYQSHKNICIESPHFSIL